MRWLIAGVVLAAVGFLMRRLLHLDGSAKTRGESAGSPRNELDTLYSPVAHEIETQTAILSITLNEAFGERKAGRHEMSWHIVHLARGEWERVTDLVSGLHAILSDVLPSTDQITLQRGVAVDHFKSRTVIGNIALHEFLDQLLFSPKRRFALQLRFLSRASQLLRQEFHRVYREGERTMDSSTELWTRLDHLFHDLDLIAKETLIAFRTLLASQTPAKAQALAAEVQLLLGRTTRASVSLTNSSTT